MFKEYKKKPVVIKALKYDGTKKMSDYVTEEVGSVTQVIETDTKKGDTEYRLVIRTLEGDMTAKTGDYIIVGIKGEVYPCDAEIFEKNYQEVTDERCN